MVREGNDGTLGWLPWIFRSVMDKKWARGAKTIDHRYANMT